MTNPTSNFGWQMPTSTDLVTDLPADFEVFGQAVDTDFVDLLGGTTGQVLSKTSATDLDFTWVTAQVGDITGVTAGTGISGGGTSGTVTVSIDTAVTADLTTSQTLTNKTLTSPALTTPTISTLTTNGDLLYGTGSGALARKAIGSTGQVLTVAAGIPSWATPASGGMTLVSNTTFTLASTIAVDSLFSSTYDNYVLYFNISAKGAGATDITVKMRSGGTTDSTANYTSQTSYMQNGTLFSTYATAVATGFTCIQNIDLGSSATIQLFSPNLASYTSGQILGQGTAEASNRMAFGSWWKPVNTQWTGISFLSAGVNITGTLSVYGLAK